MRKYLRFTVIIFTLILGTLAAKIEFGRQEFGLLDDLRKVPFILFCFLIILLIIADVIAFKKSRKFFQFFPTFSVFILLMVITYLKISRYRIQNRTTLFKVVNQAGAENVLQFDFKAGGDYILTEFNLLGSEVYYGKYQTKADTIILVTNPYNGEIRTMPKYGIISHDTMFWFRFDPMLIER